MGKQGNNEITVRNSVRPLRMVVIRYMEMKDLEWHDEQDVIFLGNVPQHSSVESGTRVIPIKEDEQTTWIDV